MLKHPFGEGEIPSPIAGFILAETAENSDWTIGFKKGNKGPGLVR